jgi:hypothetical protein
MGEDGGAAPADEAERERIEGSEEFARRDPKTLERYFLNKYLPFFNDRNSVSKVDMGFTEITGANVLDAWQRMFRDLEQHDPLSTLRNDGQALSQGPRCVERIWSGSWQGWHREKALHLR